ncbi:MAG: CbiX/SirB N-terminal domain-containing protein [Proteobacteria bacterium]|nr:CbiX/SirB N-terminal domain-containing protein [Burkholderiales bacterium]MCA0309304.1 CbiX/SirB N-terminal domain-containing protein [Pseudomonadota bacterium]
MPQPGNAHGIVLFAHGSRDAGWRAPIEAVAERIRRLAPGTPVACAYLEFTLPDLATAVHQVLATGADTVTIWPMFLGLGRHARDDLPRLVDALRAQHPQARFCLQAAIAEHPEVLQAMAQAMLQDPSS